MSYDFIKQHDILAPLLADRLLKITKSDGAQITTEDGKSFIDLSEICVLLGQKNHNYIEAIKTALDQDIGKSAYFKNHLYKYLLETTEGDFTKFFLTSSGGEAAESAVKLACKRTGRKEIVSFWNSVHGRTYLAASLSGLPVRKTGYGPIAPSIVHSPYPYCYRCPFDKTPDKCKFRCLEFLEQKIEAESSQDIAAVLIEPMQGTGIIMPPDGYLEALREWTSQRGIELILDEIQSALGRLGEMYQYQQIGVTPDMLLLGKGLGNGMHISALLVRNEIPMENIGVLAGGSGDAPLSCAAACAVFEELCSGSLLTNVNQVGTYLRESLDKLTVKHTSIGDVRGRGAAFGIELVSDRVTKDPNYKLLKRTLTELRQHGFLVGTWQSTIILRPPLSLRMDQAEKFIHCLGTILS